VAIISSQPQVSERRIGRGADSQPQLQTCSGYRILATKESKKVSAPDACHKRYRYHWINTLVPEAPIKAANGSPKVTVDTVIACLKGKPDSDVKDPTETAEGPPTIILNTSPEVVKEHCENNANAPPANAPAGVYTSKLILTARSPSTA
jgi:hypothetical protein